jgi:hypothetical protein
MPENYRNTNKYSPYSLIIKAFPLEVYKINLTAFIWIWTNETEVIQ